jgi:uncharacterized phage protein (TIGR01671 family)
MKNEIKFRAWNGLTMNYNIIAGKFGAFWVNDGPNLDGLDPNDNASLSKFNTKCADTTVIMQAIGIVDANGKEVYEGDVISLSDGNAAIRYNASQAAYEAVFEDGNAISLFEAMSFGREKLQVIGDVSEIPVQKA